MRLTVGGNLIDYPGDKSTRTADITTSKLVWNSTLSTDKAKYMVGDVKHFYLNTPMDQPEYMRIAIELIPDEIIEHYNLLPLVYKGYVYIEINKGMYGLPQAGILANKLLAKRLATKGYYQTRHTPGLWKHQFCPVQFSLVVDDFGVKYVGKEHANHLMTSLWEWYEVSTDWTRSLYCGVKLEWDYDNRTLDISMPGYVEAALRKFDHPKAHHIQRAPHRCNAPQYGAKVQLTDPIDTSPVLPTTEITKIQRTVGTLLYYARAVDNTLAVPLSAIASDQSKATEQTKEDINQLLDYCASYPNAIVRYHTSDMQLRIHSDASYLNETKARSPIGGHFYLSNKAPKPDLLHNGAILNPTGVLKVVVSSAAEAKIGALLIMNACDQSISTHLLTMDQVSCKGVLKP